MMKKRKAISPPQGAEETTSHKKASVKSSPPSLPSPTPAVVSLSSNADELSRTQAALKALQARFAQEAEEKKALKTQNERLTFEVDELKTELAFFRCDSTP